MKLIHGFRQSVPFKVPNQIVRIMKLAAIIMTTFLLQVSASGLAQKVTLNQKNITIKAAFKEIRKQTGYNILYQSGKLNDAKRIDVKYINEPLDLVLKKILADEPYTYIITDKTIVIRPKDISGGDKVSFIPYDFKDITIGGKVVDENGKGLPGATIKLKGASSSVQITTSTEGNFRLNIPGNDAVLIVSYVGYKVQEVSVSGADVELVIRMEPESKQLEELSIVSTGYQNIPKERSTGSFEKVDNVLLNRSTGGSILSRLENVTPALQIDRRLNSDRSPSLSNISIRGLSTLTQSIATPLIIVDNFPYPGNLDNINPNDVESVTVLKDAAAASIWGARAGNGVIVITTKKGRYNRPAAVSFSSNVTIQEKPDLYAFKTMTSSDYIDLEKFLFKEGFYNDKIDDIYTWPYLSPVVELMLKARQPGGTISQAAADKQIDAYRNIDARDDYSKYVYRSSIAQQYALNINGGGNQFNYFLSGGYDHNRFNTVKNSDQRITLRTAISYKPINNLEFEVGMFYTQSKFQDLGSRSKLIYSPNSGLPYVRLADDNGNPLVVGKTYGERFLANPNPAFVDWRYRPLAELNASSNSVNTYDWLMNVGANYKISEVFSASVKYQYGRTVGNNKDLQGQDSYYARDQINLLTTFDGAESKRNLPLGGILANLSSNNNSYNLRGQINANKSWGSKHEFNGLAGVEKSEKHLQSNGNNVYGYNDELLTSADVDNLTQFISPVSSFVTMPSGIVANDQRYRFTSIFANAAYTYNQRYTISASGRKDAANLFGVNANLRGAPFWSGGVSWNLSSEPFYQSKLFPYLKLRATYGYQGNTNSDLSAYSTIRYAPFPDSFFNLPYADLINPANDDLRWERVGTLNLGVDFRLKDNIISGSVEYYNRRSKEVLNDTPLDFTTGFPSTTFNSSSLKGKGLDLSLHSINLKGNFSWNTDLFLNYTSNKVEKYKSVSNIIENYVSTGLTPGASLIVGRPVYAIFSYKWAGLDPKTGDPMGYFKGEKSKDYAALIGDITPEDLQYQGSALPVWSGALRNTFTFRNISLSANIIAKLGYYFRRPSIDYESILSTGAIGHGDYAQRWQKPGDETSTNVPSFVYPNNIQRDQFYAGSAALVEKADHIRLQDITIGYTIDKPNWSVKNIKLFANFSNLGIIWKANKVGLDPEYYLGYPAPRTVAFGLNANF